jgi:hypothetical protein
LATIHVLADRRHLVAFVSGCLAVTAGVVLHLPMFWMGRDMGFRLADMAMDAGMLWGMALIVAGPRRRRLRPPAARLAAGHHAAHDPVVVARPRTRRWAPRTGG